MFGVGAPELFLIFLIVLLVFGAKRLPEIARSLGKATQEFKRAKNEFSNIANEQLSDTPAVPQAPAAPVQPALNPQTRPKTGSDAPRQ